MRNLKKVFLSLIFLLVLSISIPIEAQAATKTTKVNITQEAKNIVFKLAFEESGDYDAYLYDPDGNMYTYVKLDDRTMTCEVEKVNVGEWETTVISDNSIGKYTLSVSGKKDTATTNAGGNISVGKDIVGLKIYFKDNNLNVEWGDSSVGDVVVRVINLDNSEVLADEGIAENHFECEIPDRVTNIAVSVVPSTSRNVAGAEQTFTYNVPVRPRPQITYAAETVTNNTILDTNIKIDEKYAFHVEDNDEVIYETDINDAGEYDISLELASEGANNIKFYLISEEGNMFSYPYLIALDTISPKLSLDKDYDHAKTSNQNVSISGKVEDYDKLTVNGQEITPASDGVFEAPLNLHVGENEIVIAAVDKANNITKYDIVVERTAKKSFSSNAVAGLLCVIAVIVIAIIEVPKMLRKRKEGTVEDTRTAPSNKKTVKQSTTKEPSNVRKKKKEKPEKKNNKYDSKIQWINCHKNFTIHFILYLLILIFVFGFAIDINYIPSASMEPTLMTGNVEISNKLAYVKRKPQRGDIISFYSRENKEIMGKRIIGVAGDKIEFYDGYVYINGELLDESAYLDEDVETNCMKTFEVPKGTVFVLGDNRQNSKDSRFFKNPYIKVSDIRDRHMFSIPLAKIKSVIKSIF